MERTNSNIQFYRAQEKAYEVLVKYSDGTLPINPFDIVKKIKNIKLMTYTELAIELQKKYSSLSIKEIIDNFESERGFLKKKGKKKYILAYNEKDPPFVYIWTIFHELGHYFLEHLLEDGELLGFDSNELKNIKEREADCFARHCSSPFPVIKEVVDTTKFYDIPFLFSIMFNMGGGVIRRCSEHYYSYSYCYNSRKYQNLINKFNKSILQVEEYLQQQLFE